MAVANHRLWRYLSFRYEPTHFIWLDDLAGGLYFMNGCILAFLAAFSLLGTGSLSFNKATKLSAANNADSSFADEVEVDRSELSFTLTSSSVTETAQSLSLSMQSVKIEAWNNGNRYNDVFSVIDDSNFTDVTTAKNKATEDYEAASKAGTEYVPAVFNGAIFNVAYKKNSTIVLPQLISYGSNPIYFQISVTSISADACFDYKANEVSYAGIETIIIPEGYTMIHANAFAGAKAAGVKIKVASESPLSGWEEGWTDADVEYGYELSSSEQRQLEVNTTGSTSFGEASDFFVGYLNPDNPTENRPLVMEYSLLDSNGKTVSEHNYYEVPLSSTQTSYDAVGSTAGKSKDDRNIDVELPAGQRIDESSIVFHNIYRLLKNDAGDVVPDWESGAYKATPVRSFNKVYSIDDFIDVSYGTNTYLSDYSRISILIKANYDVFKSLNPSSYETNKASIDNGTLRIRILFTSLGMSSYRIAYVNDAGEEITKNVPLLTPISVSEINDGASMGFLIKNSDIGSDFSIHNVTSIRLCNFYLQTDLFNDTKNTITSNSKKSVRFASLELLPPDKAASHNVSVGAYFGISYAVYLAVFALGAFAYWLYCKKKYKNDEFKRVDDKKFVLKSLRNCFGFALILSSILFIIARWGLLKNTVVVYNPMDVWVIVFTIAGAIFLGIAIKDAVTSIKKTMERKKKEKLHLDADVVEDGTK